MDSGGLGKNRRSDLGIRWILDPTRAACDASKLRVGTELASTKPTQDEQGRTHHPS
jgi:hypothetical protein